MALSETFVEIHQTRTDRRGATEEEEEVEMAWGSHTRKIQNNVIPNRCYHKAPGEIKVREAGEEAENKKTKIES